MSFPSPLPTWGSRDIAGFYTPYRIGFDTTGGWVVANGGDTSYSADGDTWVAGVFPSDTYGQYDPAYLGSAWFMPAYGSWGSGMLTSADGTTWTVLAGTPTISSTNAVAVGGGNLYWLSSSPAVSLYRYDGSSWTTLTMPSEFCFRGLGANGTTVIGTTRTGAVYRSADSGATWSLVLTVPDKFSPYDTYSSHYDAQWPTYDDSTGTWYLVVTQVHDVGGAESSIARLAKSTDDGATWTISTTNIGAEYIGVNYLSVGDGLVFVALSSGYYVGSDDDGATWVSLGGGMAANFIQYGGGRAVRTSASDQVEVATFVSSTLEESAIEALTLGDSVQTAIAYFALCVSGASAASSAIGAKLLVAVVTSAAAAATSHLEQIFERAMGISAVGVATPLTLGAILNAIATSSVRGMVSTHVPDSGEAVWVVNAETSGSTRYENFGFNSFAKRGEEYLACKPDGIYTLVGDTDAGVPIQAMASFGKQDFGTSVLKRVSNIYVGTSSGGKLYIKVLCDGQDYLYAARDASGTLETQRFDLGKGLRANFLEFELYNASGDDFELANIEFVALPLSRRI